MINMLLRALGFAWSLPVTVAGALVALLVVLRFGLRSVYARGPGNWGGWVLEVELDSDTVFGMGAVTIGHVQIYARGMPERLRSHEDVHTLQCDLLGVLMVTYFVCFAGQFTYWLARSGSGELAYWLAYHDNPFEAWARLWARRAGAA